MQTATSSKSILDETQNRMQKSVDATHNEFRSIHTGRASIALVEAIQVECYGAFKPLKGLASITTPDAKTVTIQPWDPSLIPAIDRAIVKAELGLVPTNDGRVVRIKVPSLTEERRKELDKIIRKIAEDGRVSIRNIRHEANEAIKRLEKAKSVTEDESRATQKKVQDATDKFTKMVDELVAKKEVELKEV